MAITIMIIIPIFKYKQKYYYEEQTLQQYAQQ